MSETLNHNFYIEFYILLASGGNRIIYLLCCAEDEGSAEKDGKQMEIELTNKKAIFIYKRSLSTSEMLSQTKANHLKLVMPFIFPFYFNKPSE